MKVYISVDMEGVACVTHGDHVKMEGGTYEVARKWTTGEANAAIEGAFEAGADEIVVADGHGSGRNLLPDELHPKVTLVQGTPRPLGMMEGLDESFQAAFFIGYHARAGHATGVLAHSFWGAIVREVRLNGEAVSEAVFNAAVAGHFEVPVALIAGDDALAEEIEKKLPWVERVVTKWAVSRSAARNLTPAGAQQAIRTAAQAALKGIADKASYRLPAPIRLEVAFRRGVHAQLAGDIPGVERVDSITLSFTGSDMLEVDRIWKLMLKVCRS
ncbi:MAG: M55 family metallopeptidase [Anaerolineales bacterium]|jgi:D-amino peptidase